MKEKINEKIKYREEYRPFAPSVLEERASTFFNIDSDVNYNFMIETVAATEIAKKQVPAIVHVDNTSRIQTVEKDRNNKYWSLINEFYKLTKIPMLLNTSLNLNGMPIVSSFQDSLVCFENSDLDFLVVEEWIIWKNN